ncbi:cytochrome c [Oxalobacteraceae bacterium A2-2]
MHTIWLSALLTAVAAWAAPAPAAATAATTAATTADTQLIRQGAYLARAGDCAACHTAAGGQPFAGGLGLATPIGKVYSTNITPDREAGIGKWSFQDFDRLMRTGVTPAGYTVYPAMPYPSYSRLSEADMKALYAYFMQGVAPAATSNRKSDIPWPLSLRFPLAVWRWMFAPTPQPHTVAAGGDQPLQRGAYLVEGLGHCGACHTERGLAMQEKALTGLGNKDYLAGGSVVDGWNVPSLRNEHGGGLGGWSEADIVAFLKTGRNGHTAAFGGMSDVVRHSTQYLSDADLGAMARYLKSLRASNGAPPFQGDPAVAQALYHGKPGSEGALLYLNKCAGCHRSDGKGYQRAFPALAGNAILQSQDPTSAINIVLSGSAVPATHGAPSSLAMAPYADQLSDEQVAQVVNFIQQSWGNRGGATSARQVAKIRKTITPLKPAGAAAYAAGRAGTLHPPATK